MSDGLKVGDRAWRITRGKHQGRLCWASDTKIDQAKADKSKVKATLITENVPFYGTWGEREVMINPTYLKQVWVVAKWSDEV